MRLTVKNLLSMIIATLVVLACFLGSLFGSTPVAIPCTVILLGFCWVMIRYDKFSIQ